MPLLLNRARADDVTLAWTVGAWPRLGLGRGIALYSTADGMVVVPFPDAPPLVEVAFDARLIGPDAELRWLRTGRRGGDRIGPAVMVGEAEIPRVEGFVRLEPHSAYGRDVGYALPARLLADGARVDVDVRVREYVDSGDPDHPGRVDERITAAEIRA